MPLSGVAPLYIGVVARFDGRQLARVKLELYGLKRWFLSLVRLECRLPANGGFSWRVSWFSTVLGPSLVTC